MRLKQVMYAWAAAPSGGLAPVDVGHVLQALSTGTALSLFSGLSPHLQCFPFSLATPQLNATLCSSYLHVSYDRLETNCENTLYCKLIRAYS